jgi:hypothetical protein
MRIQKHTTGIAGLLELILTGKAAKAAGMISVSSELSSSVLLDAPDGASPANTGFRNNSAPSALRMTRPTVSGVVSDQACVSVLYAPSRNINELKKY